MSEVPDGTAASAPAVVLLHPREEGNVGAVARAMANMGLERLIVVEPAADFGGVARTFAVGAAHVLDVAVRVGSLDEALAPFRLVVGTTSSRGREREALVPVDALVARLAGYAVAPQDVALLFGPEVSGLGNDDLARCAVVATIPCAPRQPTLNLAQAVLIVAWELARPGAGAAWAPALGRPAPPAPRKALDGLLARGAQLLQRVGFARDSTFAGVREDLAALLARTAPDEREVAILAGIVRRIGLALDGRSGSGERPFR